MREKLEPIIQASAIPSVALMVLHHSEVVIHHAWGWIDPETRQIPASLETRFDLASITKLFTVSAFLSLVSADKVRLDDTLASVIPEFGKINPRPMDGGQDPHSKIMQPTPPEIKGKTVDPSLVTFRHLLTHTSGIAAWRDVYNSAGLPPQPPDRPPVIGREARWSKALQALYRYPFVGFPGDKVRYSDLGLMLMGEAVSRLHTGDSGKLDEAIEQRVTQPLGLETVVFNPVRNGFPREKVAPTENDPTWRKRRVWGEVHDENACGVGGIAGHAGLFATVESIARFGQAWLTYDSRLGIEKALMQQAVQEQAVTGNERRGLGWMLRSHQGSSAGDKLSADTFGHTGFVGNSLFIDPTRELVIAMLTNWVYLGRETPGLFEFRRTMHDTIMESL